jgi:hypothetical protein
MITEAYLDSPLCLPLGLAKRGNMNIRSSKLRFRVTFVTFDGFQRRHARGMELQHLGARE